MRLRKALTSDCAHFYLFVACRADIRSCLASFTPWLPCSAEQLAMMDAPPIGGDQIG